jgi:hypothetical protein
LVDGRSERFFEARLRGDALDPEAWIGLDGWSMAPALRPGDRLRVEPFGAAPPSAGEVVVARRGARLVTHRLRSLASGRAITRGDGCLRADPPIAVEALVGRVVEIRRGGRSFAPPPPPGLAARVAIWVRARVLQSIVRAR